MEDALHCFAGCTSLFCRMHFTVLQDALHCFQSQTSGGYETVKFKLILITFSVGYIQQELGTTYIHTYTHTYIHTYIRKFKGRGPVHNEGYKSRLKTADYSIPASTELFSKTSQINHG